MRPIHLVRLDKPRPAVILTRPQVRSHLNQITIAPITSTVRGLSTEVAVGVRNGLDHESIVNCDLITTVPAGDVGPVIGWFLEDQEPALARAVTAAFLLVGTS